MPAHRSSSSLHGSWPPSGTTSRSKLSTSCAGVIRTYECCAWAKRIRRIPRRWPFGTWSTRWDSIYTLRANAVAIDETRQQMKGQMFAESESHFVVLEQTLSSIPSALRFHNIEPAELDVANITPKSLVI